MFILLRRFWASSLDLDSSISQGSIPRRLSSLFGSLSAGIAAVRLEVFEVYFAHDL